MIKQHTYPAKWQDQPKDLIPLTILVVGPVGWGDQVPKEVQSAYSCDGALETSRNRDCVLYTAQTAEEGLQVIQQRNPHLTIIDTNLTSSHTGNDGITKVLVPARKDGYQGKVLCLGYEERGDRWESRTAGADEFLEEPAARKGLNLQKTMRFLLEQCPFVYSPKKH
jgi:CheY-like chemotaxis protein